MKIEAYKCGKCNQIKESDEIVAIIPIEDLFDRTKSFPISHENKKWPVHLCLECYRTNVIVPASNKFNRAKFEAEYMKEIHELSMHLRKTLVFQSFKNPKK